jgi:transposase
MLAIFMESEQRVIIKFLFNEGADAPQISERLRAQFHGDAYALRTLQFWITELRLGREDLHDEPRTGRPSTENHPTKIQELLDENPFESARSMAEILQVSHSTVLKHLHEDFRFQSFHLRWVPHVLTPELRE